MKLIEERIGSDAESVIETQAARTRTYRQHGPTNQQGRGDSTDDEDDGENNDDNQGRSIYRTDHRSFDNGI